MSLRDAVNIAAPAGPGRLAGVRMAGFSSRSPVELELAVVPYPAVTVFVDFGDGILVGSGDGGQQQGSVVAGLAASTVRGRGRQVDCLQIRLSPVLAYSVLGPPESTVVPLAFTDLMRDKGSWSDRFTVAEAALGRRSESGRAVDPEIGYAWQRLVDTRGRVRIERLGEEVGWSRKRLWSRFRAQLGAPPKRAAQLIRFDHAAHRLAAGQRPAEVAAATGYADQSHLHRDAHAFAALTPAALATAPWLAVDDLAWPGWPRGM